MKYRCREDSPFRKYYADSGITVCDRWKIFENFLQDMGVRPSTDLEIDRIDNKRGYEPGNCRWATREEQHSNKRNNRWYEYNGKLRTLSQWAHCVGISASVITGRLNKGWSIEKALMTPVRGKRKNRKKSEIEMSKARPRRKYEKNPQEGRWQ